MKLNSETIHQICNLQHKITVCQIYLKDATGLYTSDMVGQMIDDLKLKSKLGDYQDELNQLLSTLNIDDVKETFSDKEYIQLPENKFTFDLQREASKEVIGKALTLEEIMEQKGLL